MFGLKSGADLLVQRRPPFVVVSTRISGSSDSFAAAKTFRVFDGSTATATSVWTPDARETSCTYDPAATQGLLALWTVLSQIVMAVPASSTKITTPSITSFRTLDRTLD